MEEPGARKQRRTLLQPQYFGLVVDALTGVTALASIVREFILDATESCILVPPPPTPTDLSTRTQEEQKEQRPLLRRLFDVLVLEDLGSSVGVDKRYAQIALPTDDSKQYGALTVLGGELAQWLTHNREQIQRYDWLKAEWCSVGDGLNEYLKENLVGRQQRHYAASLSPTSPYLLMTYGVSDYWRDATFSLRRLTGGTGTVPIDLSPCIAAEQTLLSYRDVLLTEETNSDHHWATTTEDTKKQFFWYSIRDLSGNNINMHLKKQNVHDEKDWKAFDLPGTPASASYGDCYIYSNERHVYCVVVQPSYWRAGNTKFAPIPKLFRHCLEMDTMVAVPLPPSPLLTLNECKGRVSAEELAEHNEYLWECEDKTPPISMEQYEDLMWREATNVQPDWLWQHAVVCSNGDLLAGYHEFPRHRWRPRCAQYYSVETNAWTPVLRCSDDEIRIGPVAVPSELFMA